jgi:hypothetical protein
MKKLRVLIAAISLAAAMIVVSAPPASANCAGEPDVCAAVCQVGLGNKYTKDFFAFCYIW